jgi:hypothetical protein
MFDYRYGYILATKLTMFGLVVALTGVHTLVVGPRLLRLQSEPAASTSPELCSLRKWSILISVLTLLLSIAILYCAALLRSAFAFGQP